MGGSKEIMVVGGEGSSGRMICRAAEVEHWVAQGWVVGEYKDSSSGRVNLKLQK